MDNRQIVFTKPNTAELLDAEYRKPNDNEVVVKTEFSTVSCGTEKANITGDPNVAGNAAAGVSFPRISGYSSAGYIVEKGKGAAGLEIGDKVAVYWGKHMRYNTVSEKNAVKITDENVSMQEAALSFITTFPLAAIRKTNLEIGESALVMGLGILGQLAVRLLKAAGAVPVIAADPIEGRRLEALKGGADYAFNPMEKDFAGKIKRRRKHGDRSNGRRRGA